QLASFAADLIESIRRLEANRSRASFIAKHLALEATDLPREVDRKVESLGDGTAVARGDGPVHETVFIVTIDIVMPKLDLRAKVDPETLLLFEKMKDAREAILPTRERHDDYIVAGEIHRVLLMRRRDLSYGFIGDRRYAS